MPIRQPYPQDHASHIPILIGIGTKTRIRRALELGAGSYSTSLFLNHDVFPDLIELVSVEHDPEWTTKVRALSNDPRITLTPDQPVDRSRFDLIFIDSAHMAERVEAMRSMAVQPEITGLIVIHDSENPTYRNEFAPFRWFDIDSYEPSTAILCHDHGKWDAVRGMLEDIRLVVQQYADQPPDDVNAWVKRFSDPNPPRLTVSIAMVAYRRHEQLRNTLETFLWQTRKPDQIVIVEDGYDGGLTENVCREYSDRLPIEYFCRRNRPDVVFSNAAIPRNIGIRKSTGDIIVIQNPEVRFTKPSDLANIVGPTESDPMVATCAPCEALNEDGSHKMWYCNPNIAGNVNHHCMAFRRDQLIALGGFLETFKGYGYEDNSFHYRFNRTGVRSIFAKDVVTQHQWHWSPPYSPDNVTNDAYNREIAETEVREIMEGKRTIEANVGKNWGDINS